MLFSGVYQLWEDPLIVSCLIGAEHHAVAIDQPADVLLHEAWMPTWRSMPALFRYQWQAARRQKRIHFMGGGTDASRLFRTCRLPGALVNISTYIDQRAFDVTPTPKKYDAIYPARMVPYKRLHLAAEVRSLYVHTYGECRKEDGTFDLHRFEPLLAHAAFNPSPVSPEDLVASYNSARVVLALSEVEGAMLGSTEGMLCGLPQVSTRCRGGREQFFDDRYVRVVAPEPGPIAAAVAELIRRELDPHMIRTETRKKLQAHRDRLVDYLIGVIKSRKARVPTRNAVEQRLFGGPHELLNCYVNRRRFGDLGWLRGTTSNSTV